MTEEDSERRIVRLLTVIVWAWFVPCTLALTIMCILIIKELLS